MAIYRRYLPNGDLEESEHPTLEDAMRIACEDLLSGDATPWYVTSQTSEEIYWRDEIVAWCQRNQGGMLPDNEQAV